MNKPNSKAPAGLRDVTVRLYNQYMDWYIINKILNNERERTNILKLLTWCEHRVKDKIITD
jgi:hypothetical protein